MATLCDTKIELNGVEYGIAGIDVGNSRVKIHHDDVFLSFPYDKEWKKNVQHHFRDHVSRRYLIGLSSVNPKQTTAIVKVLQRIPGHLVINAHSLLMRNDQLLSLGKVENAGIDRMLGAIGAMTKAQPPIITVDCGPAVTVNLVSADHFFLGGVIFAGLSTQLFGLAKQTAAIPESKYVPPTNNMGVNTMQCLMAGVTSSVIGGVLRTVRAYMADELKLKDVSVIVTGGESQQVLEALKAEGFRTEFHQHMVTDGILALLSEAQLVDLQDSIIAKILN